MFCNEIRLSNTSMKYRTFMCLLLSTFAHQPAHTLCCRAAHTCTRECGQLIMSSSVCLPGTSADQTQLWRTAKPTPIEPAVRRLIPRDQVCDQPPQETHWRGGGGKACDRGGHYAGRGQRRGLSPDPFLIHQFPTGVRTRLTQGRGGGTPQPTPCASATERADPTISSTNPCAVAFQA